MRLDRELLGELALAEDLHVLDELRDDALAPGAPSRSTVARVEQLLEIATTLIGKTSTRFGFLKPRFGMRRGIGI